MSNLQSSDEVAEPLCREIRERHKLTTFHIFDDANGWRVFGFRQHPKGFQASVEHGEGPKIAKALLDLDRRLIEGPIHK